MGSASASAAGNQNSWTPYNEYKDCSVGICSIYCPQFCYFIFPPPPDDDDDSASPFSPLIIAVIGVLASAFVLVSYYTIVTRYCTRSQDAEYSADEAQAAASGLEEAAIRAITVCRYRKGEGLIEGSECAVCLSEFEEEECLRLLPKCSHAFHLPCIDTWLKSHPNCPLCRAAVVAAELIVVVPKSPNGNAEESGGGVRQLRRSVSLPHVVVEMGEFGEDLARKRCLSWREI